MPVAFLQLLECQGAIPDTLKMQTTCCYRTCFKLALKAQQGQHARAEAENDRAVQGTEFYRNTQIQPL